MPNRTRFSQVFSYIIELREKYAVKWCNYVLRNYIKLNLKAEQYTQHKF